MKKERFNRRIASLTNKKNGNGILAVLPYQAVLIVLILFIVIFLADKSWAGPPFRTDDPEPVDFKHGEFYVATTFTDNVGASSGTLPHFEANYGILPNTMVHVIIPFAFSKTHGETTQYGFGDLEAGIKYRFINMEDAHFMVGTFPLVDFKTGDSYRGLGASHTKFFIPIWLQKSWEPWTTYGGGGYWRNPGEGNKDYWFFGWEVQRDISKMLTLGAELFAQTKTTDNGHHEVGFNIGAVINLTDDHHILVSLGQDISGDNNFSMYVAYQLTFGPREEKK
jgi:hypothetical protein